MSPATTTRPRRLSIRLAAVSSLSALLLGCSHDMSDLYRFVNDIQSRKDAYVEPLPAFPQYDAISYQAHQLRDPFTPTKKVVAASKAAHPAANRRREALERFPLDSLRFVGGLGRNQSSWALVQDPNGTIHRLSPGNHLGQNYGKIIAVTETKILIQELISDAATGEWVSRPAELSLGDQ